MPLRAAAGAEATAQYSIPIPARKHTENTRSREPDPWRRPTPVPPPSAAAASVSELPVTKRSTLPVARGLAVVLLFATVALGFGLYTTNSDLARSQQKVSTLTQQTRQQTATIASKQSQISSLSSEAARLHGVVQSCQRTAAIMARAWQLTDQARRWTVKAVGAAAVGDYIDAAYFLQHSSGLMRQGNGVITGAGDDVQACARSAQSGSSGSIS
jgi:hypothetical protein